jgi:hypothetical protein
MLLLLLLLRGWPCGAILRMPPCSPSLATAVHKEYQPEPALKHEGTLPFSCMDMHAVR